MSLYKFVIETTKRVFILWKEYYYIEYPRRSNGLECNEFGPCKRNRDFRSKEKKMNLCLMKQTFSSEIWLEGVEVTHLDFITRNKDQLNALS